MSVALVLPAALRHEFPKLHDWRLVATNVRDALREIESMEPRLYRQICDETGAVRRHIHVFINNDCVCSKTGLDSQLTEGDVLSLLTAVSGG